MDRLAQHVGDPSTYASRKRAWRESVGYDDVRTRMRITASNEDMVRHVLGEAEELDATVTQASERRFGLDLPLGDLVGPGRIRIGLTDGAPAKMTFRCGEDWVDVPGRFWNTFSILRQGDIPEDVDLWRFEGGLLDARASKGAATVTLGSFANRTATLEQWRASANAIRLLLSGECEVSLLFPQGSAIIGTIRQGSVADAPAVNEIEAAAAFAVRVGLPDSMELTLDDLLADHDGRVLCVQFRRGEEAQLTFRPDGVAATELPAGAPIVFTCPLLGRLGRRFAASIATTAPASWTVSEGSVRSTATITHQTRWVLTDHAEAALEALDTLKREAQDQQTGEDTLYVWLGGLSRLPRVDDGQ